MVQSSKSFTNVENIRLLLDHHGNCRRPSAIAALLLSKHEDVTQLNDTKKTTISTQVSSRRPDLMSKGNHVSSTDGANSVPALSFTGMSTASSVGDFMTTTDVVEASEDTNEPSWFSDLKTPRSEVEKITSRDEHVIRSTDMHDDHMNGGLTRKTSTKSRRASKDASMITRHRQIVTDVNREHSVIELCASTETPMVSRRHVGESNDDSKNTSPVPRSRVTSENSVLLSQLPSAAGGAVPRRGGRRCVTKAEEREEEASFRQSLEALKKSDQSNRSRIESELRSSTHMESVLMPSELRHLDVADGVLSNEIEKQNILKQRSVRIDAVQEKVSSALQDLATTMSTINNFGRRDDDEGLTALDNEEVGSIGSQEEQRTSTTCFDDNYLENSVYEIPVSPSGTIFKLEILSNWGDPYYVGLSGLDLFDDKGTALTSTSGVHSITAVPGDINDLPEYDHDPRTVANLLGMTNNLVLSLLLLFSLCAEVFNSCANYLQMKSTLLVTICMCGSPLMARL